MNQSRVQAAGPVPCSALIGILGKCPPQVHPPDGGVAGWFKGDMPGTPMCPPDFCTTVGHALQRGCGGLGSTVIADPKVGSVLRHLRENVERRADSGPLLSRVDHLLDRWRMLINPTRATGTVASFSRQELRRAGSPRTETRLAAPLRRSSSLGSWRW